MLRRSLPIQSPICLARLRDDLSRAYAGSRGRSAPGRMAFRHARMDDRLGVDAALEELRWLKRDSGERASARSTGTMACPSLDAEVEVSRLWPASRTGHHCCWRLRNAFGLARATGAQRRERRRRPWAAAGRRCRRSRRTCTFRYSTSVRQPADIAAAARQRLRHRAHPYVDIGRRDTAQLERAGPRAHRARRAHAHRRSSATLRGVA